MVDYLEYLALDAGSLGTKERQRQYFQELAMKSDKLAERYPKRSKASRQMARLKKLDREVGASPAPTGLYRRSS
jgi:hypothetical protein